MEASDDVRDESFWDTEPLHAVVLEEDLSIDYLQVLEHSMILPEGWLVEGVPALGRQFSEGWHKVDSFQKGGIRSTEKLSDGWH